MSLDADALFRLLPAIYRIRDAETAGTVGALLTASEAAELAALETLPAPTADEQQRIAVLRAQATRGPLKALTEVLASELAVVEENLTQLYDDLFIETCADWVVPYIGDLIGYEPLHARGRGRAPARAEVAHTIALRRRKGTATALEQIATDVTGWGARVVEYFELIAATQYLNHPRPHCLATADLRDAEALAQRGGAFESLRHGVDVRPIDSAAGIGRGRFNIPNIGIFLWRIGAFRRTRSPAVRVDDRRWLVSPLGHPLPLYTRPRAEDEITHLAEPINVPAPIARRRFAAHPDLYYGTRAAPGSEPDNADPSLLLYLDGAEVSRGQLAVCNLADDGLAWAHEPPPGRVAIDPELGRIALAADLPAPASVRVTYYEGFPAAMGGGEYPRARAADPEGTHVVHVPGDHASIQSAIDALRAFAQAAPAEATPFGVVEIGDSGRYQESLSIEIEAGWSFALRAAPVCRPVLILPADLDLRGGPGSSFTLDGVMVAGGALRVPTPDNQLARLQVSHATLVPGLALDGTGAPVAPGAPGLIVEPDGVAVSVDHAILGAVALAEGSSFSASDSILDATGPQRIAFSAPDGVSSGGTLSLDACTLIGQINAVAIGLVTNSLLLARPAPGDTRPPINALRRQTGCVRFSYLADRSAVPRRHRCQPPARDASAGPAADGSAEVAPRFTSLSYGTPAYCQLSTLTPDAIRAGADDEGEMGAYHALYPAQREANLRVRLQELLRAGLAAGIYYAT